MKGFQSDKNSIIIKKKEPKRKFVKQKVKRVQPQVIFRSPPPKQDSKAAFSSASFIRRLQDELQFLLVPLILVVILAILSLINLYFAQNIAANKVNVSQPDLTINPYPFVDTSFKPQISAQAAIALDADSQVILYSKNPQLRFSMASTTKIMTALIGLEYYAPYAVLTIKSSGVEGSGLGLVPGDKFYFEDLLYAMLLPSANDAAVAIADNYPGGQKAFVARMNEKAQTLYLTNTHYVDPVGLNDDGDYTTVVDLSRLSSIAIKNKNFSTVTGTKQIAITNLSRKKQYSLFNLNKLLGFYGVNGIKTGTTEGAGEVLVTSSVQNGHTYIVIVMDSDNRFADTENLLSFVNQHVKYVLPQIPFNR